jgi:hypothetical protein
MRAELKNEGDVKKIVKDVLKKTEKCYWFMPSANGFGRAGIPDFVGWVNGRAFAVETKFGRGECTPNQLREIEASTNAGAQVWIVRETSVEAWSSEFKGWASLCS